ncbi:hypothetical protein R1sor_005674 [Riccia sorocarpa]|uniref:Uncharacterized protein n=1 Tax=Riccia sorocarpa TaxID=122646 RepID=A0ABD3HKV5_9MARC
MAVNVGRALTAPLLFLNFAMFVVVLGLAGHFLDEIITGTAGGNAATPIFVPLALIAGVVGCASVIAGVFHLAFWRNETLASTNVVAWVSWSLILLAMGLASKEIHIGGRSSKHRVLEAFVIILSFTQLVYILVLHAGVLGGPRYGPAYEKIVVPAEAKVSPPAATTGGSPTAAAAV